MGKTYPWPVKAIVCVSIIGLALFLGMSHSEEDTFLDASAQFERGLRYYCGDGVPVDYSKAAELYRKAAEQGDADGPNGVKFSSPKYVPSCRHKLTSSGHRLSRSTSGSQRFASKITPVNRTQKQPQSCSDRGCQEAGDESRTHNIPLGRLDVWPHKKGPHDFPERKIRLT